MLGLDRRLFCELASGDVLYHSEMADELIIRAVARIAFDVDPAKLSVRTNPSEFQHQLRPRSPAVFSHAPESVTIVGMCERENRSQWNRSRLRQACDFEQLRRPDRAL